MSVEIRYVGAPSGLNHAKDEQWWNASKSEVADAITATINTISGSQKPRLRQLEVAARLYGNLPTMGLGGLSLSRLSNAYPALRSQITRNVLQIAVDTYVSQVATEKPRPYFLTSGGNYHQRRRAKMLTKFTDGVFHEGKVPKITKACSRDCSVWGTGIIKTAAINGRVAFERVLPHDIWVDDIEAFERAPRQMHQVKKVDRLVMLSVFPDLEEELKRAESAKVDEIGTIVTVADQLQVRESWHLPSSPEAEDGRHVISIEGLALLDEEWTRDSFPFSFLRWNERLYGFWGQGGVEQHQNLQLEINSLMQTIQRAYRLGGSFKIFVPMGSKIPKEHINNDIGAIISYAGSTPPSYVTPPLIPAEVYGHLKELTQAIYEGFGVSQMMARSTVPAGVTSGVALREVRDEAAGRQLPASQDFGDLHIDLARQAIDTIKEIVGDKGGSYSVNVPGRKFLEQVDWADVDLEEEQFTMQCFPTSSLPKDPAGRLQTVQEYVQAGFLTPRQAKRALDFPDLEQIESLQNATEDWLAHILDLIVDKGIYTVPDPFDDLQLAREMALEYYAQGKTGGLEEERLELLRTFMGQIDQMQAEAQQAAMAQQAMQAGQPAANESILTEQVRQRAAGGDTAIAG